MPLSCLAQGEQDATDWMKTVYNADNGLPTGEANDLYEDWDGNIWDFGGYWL